MPTDTTPLTAQALADAACTCDGAACGRGVLAQFTAFMIKNKDTQVSKAAAEEAGRSAKRMVTCLIEKGVERKEIVKVMMGSSKTP